MQLCVLLLSSVEKSCLQCADAARKRIMSQTIHLGRVKLTDLTEDDTLPNRQKLIERNKDVIFLILILAIHVKLSNVLHAKLLLLQLDFVCTGSKFGRESSDVVWEGGGEKNDLDAFAGE